MMQIHTLYRTLLTTYGPQGWWPLLLRDDTDPRGWRMDYRPGDYTHPLTPHERLEVAMGAILTQNTAWTNVTTALINLRSEGPITRTMLDRLEDHELSQMIRPAGYYNQKTQKIRAYLKQRQSPTITPTRDQLLSIWGIGEETADSILLYAYHQPAIVVDAYTRRILSIHGIIPNAMKMSYASLQQTIRQTLSSDNPDEHKEFHALIVAHGKRYYQRKPYGKHDPLLMD